MADKQQYHSETIDLPSEGRVYSKDSPLSSGKIEVKYMTAKEEDILTSQNLIKKGVVIEKLLDSLILTKGVSTNDLVLGDKNAVMVASRIGIRVMMTVKLASVEPSPPPVGPASLSAYR